MKKLAVCGAGPYLGASGSGGDDLGGISQPAASAKAGGMSGTENEETPMTKDGPEMSGQDEPLSREQASKERIEVRSCV